MKLIHEKFKSLLAQRRKLRAESSALRNKLGRGVMTVQVQPYEVRLHLIDTFCFKTVQT